MSSSLAGTWSVCDRLLQRWRYRMVLPHIPPQSIVADLGCGNGGFLHHIAGRIARGYGLDSAIPADTKNLTFIAADLNAPLPLPDASVDVVASLAVLEHLENADRFTSEMGRILRPGGICLLTTPTPAAKPLLEFLAFRLKIISENDIRDHRHYFSRNELKELFHTYRQLDIRPFQCGLNTLLIARR